MKRTWLLSCLSLVCLMGSLSAKTYFVKMNGSGDGSSWSTAFGHPQQALKIAESGDIIWVATGTYTPAQNNNRSVSFRVPSGVQFYGGFVGFENSLSERPVGEQPTVLSGEIGIESSVRDNSLTVLYLEAGKGTIVDGFTITGGHADGDLEEQREYSKGGGLFINSAKAFFTATISNCIFVNNYALDGGAVYNFSKGGFSNPIFLACQFINNEAEFDGGAIYNDGRTGGKCVPIFEGCQFERNDANYGGAVCNFGTSGEARPEFRHCMFNDNSARNTGLSIFNIDIQGICDPLLVHCQFIKEDDLNIPQIASCQAVKTSSLRPKKEEKRIFYN